MKISTPSGKALVKNQQKKKRPIWVTKTYWQVDGQWRADKDFRSVSKTSPVAETRRALKSMLRKNTAPKPLLIVTREIAPPAPATPDFTQLQMTNLQ